MTGPLRDIREFLGDADAYRDELYKRWTGLLSYRYIGRNHSSMNVGDTDDTVVIRRDMRNDAGGIMVAPLAIASPEGCQTDMVAVPNPVIASVQIVDPGYDVRKIEIEEQEIILGKSSTRGEFRTDFNRKEDVDLPAELRTLGVEVWFSKSSLGV